MHLRCFHLLAQFDKVAFYSLQKKGGAAKQAKDPPEGMNFVDLTDEILDFSDAAALMENLDLIYFCGYGSGSFGRGAW